MNETKVYCCDCRHCIVNRTELFGEIVEKHCGKAIEYEDTAFEKKPKRENMEQMNGRNRCPHYIHFLDILGKPLGEKEEYEAEARRRASERREHIRRYTLKEDWTELKETFGGR